MSCDTKYDTFANVCLDAVRDDSVFATFKQNPGLTYMLEQDWETTEYIGTRFTECLNERYSSLLPHLPWTKYRENDAFGNPRLHEYTQLQVSLEDYWFSHTTLRYIYFALDLVSFLKQTWTVPPSTFSIVEIGGGYGGQCKMVIDTLAYFYPTMTVEYTIIDLDPVSRLQQKYLHRIGVHNVRCVTPDTYRKDQTYDCCFSSYAIGEIGLEYQFDYIEHVLLYSTLLFLVWNQTPINPYLEYHRTLSVEDEYPQFTPGNRVITSYR